MAKEWRMHSILGQARTNTNPRRSKQASKHQHLNNERYYGNRVGSVLGARIVNGSWRERERHFVDSVWSMWWRSTTNRHFLFRERRRLLRPHVSLSLLSPFFVRDQRFPVEDTHTHTHVSSLVRYYLNVEPFVPIAVTGQFDRRWSMLLAIIVRRFLKKDATTIGWRDDSFKIEDTAPISRLSIFYLWLKKKF